MTDKRSVGRPRLYKPEYGLTRQVGVSIPVAMLERVDEIAKRRKTSRSDVLVTMVDEALKGMSKQVQDGSRVEPGNG